RETVGERGVLRLGQTVELSRERAVSVQEPAEVALHRVTQLVHADGAGAVTAVPRLGQDQPVEQGRTQPRVGAPGGHQPPPAGGVAAISIERTSRSATSRSPASVRATSTFCPDPRRSKPPTSSQAVRFPTRRAGSAAAADPKYRDGRCTEARS